MGHNAIRLCSAPGWMVMALAACGSEPPARGPFTLAAPQPPAAHSAAQFKTIDLHPNGFTVSEASGSGAGEQTGWGLGPATDSWIHALLWSGSAESVVDLNPSGFTFSQATGIGDGQQTGFGSGPATDGWRHALLWSGTAESVVDLNPSGFTNSQASGIGGVQQAGFG